MAYGLIRDILDILKKEALNELSLAKAIKLAIGVKERNRLYIAGKEVEP